jgi:NAD(P)H-dependent FMN reductase
VSGAELGKIRIAIIVASTRSTRFADYPLAWVTEQLATVSRFDIDVIDLREHPLPFYDLPAPPARAHRAYSFDEERALGERLDSADAYIVITNEYNHGYSAALKNVLDHFFAEFVHKPVAFIGYGNVGGSRAIEQLRQVVAELDMVSVRFTVHVMGGEMADVRRGDLSVFTRLKPRLAMMIESLEWWARATAVARSSG